MGVVSTKSISCSLRRLLCLPRDQNPPLPGPPSAPLSLWLPFRLFPRGFMLCSPAGLHVSGAPSLPFREPVQARVPVPQQIHKRDLPGLPAEQTWNQTPSGDCHAHSSAGATVPPAASTASAPVLPCGPSHSRQSEALRAQPCPASTAGVFSGGRGTSAPKAPHV